MSLSIEIPVFNYNITLFNTLSNCEICFNNINKGIKLQFKAEIYTKSIILFCSICIKKNGIRISGLIVQVQGWVYYLIHKGLFIYIPENLLEKCLNYLD